MFNKKTVIIAATLSVASFTAQAEVGDISIGVGAGLTQGTGFEVGYQISDKVGVRAVSYSGELSQTETMDGINYNIALKTKTPGVMLDFYPTDGGSLRLTVGAVDNGNSLSATASAASSYTIGGTLYTAAQVGSLKSEVAFEGITPYLGLGYRMFATERLSIDFDAGLLIGSAPGVTMTADGTLANDSAFMAELEAERKSLEGDLSSFKYMPMAKIALTYKF